MDIKTSPSGRIVRAATGYESFVPYPLPPLIEWNAPLITALGQATHAIGMLAQEGTRLPNPHLLIRPFIAREAVLSSRIEGTVSTISDILATEAGAPVNVDKEDLQEVYNYILALDHGLSRRDKLPLSLRLIREVHQKLMFGVRGEQASPGEFRKTQNWIGVPGSTIATAKYVPPLPEELMGCLDAFEKYMHNNTLPPLIHAALCHYQFEAIHPFLDGNGRVGRLLIVLMLIERNMLPAPLLYISAFFEATRSEYHQLLYRVSREGVWDEWILYFLHGVTLQSKDVLSRAERINNLLINWKIKAGNKQGGLLQQMIDHLARNPYYLTGRAAEQYGVAFTTAQRAIANLEDMGILTKVSGNLRDRVYCATEILSILEEPTKITPAESL